MTKTQYPKPIYIEPSKEEINAAAKRLARAWREANPGQESRLVNRLELGLK
jgi:hypothetical protein